jgi:uncharacterized membrane protein
VEAAAAIAALWVLFAATHMGLSSARVRPVLVASLGERGFLGVYSLAAFATFVPLVWVYAIHRHDGALLYAFTIPEALRFALYAFQALAFTLIVGGIVRPSPASLGAPAPDAGAVAPVHAITRHPLFAGVGLFGALHLPFMGFATDVAFWVGFPLFAVIGCWHQDRRKSETEGETFREWLARTPFWISPRGAALRRLAPWLPVLGVGLAWGLRWLHGPLFR